MARAEEITAGGGGAWSRFARAFQSRRSSRWAWRALLLCVGLAVFAPLIANDRPYFARLRDAASFREATSLLMPITLSFVQQGKALATSQPGSQAEFDAEERALESRIAFLERASGSEHSRDPQNALFQLTTSEKALGAAARAHDAPRCGKLADELLTVASSTVSALAIDEAAETTLVAQTSWPLFRSLRALDIALMLSWLGLASFGVWRRCVPRGSIRTRVVALILVALVLGGLAQLVPHSNDDFDASLWKPRLAADAQSSCVFPPIAFGPSETHLDEAQHPPQIASRHWCGTDALGRDLFARLLYAGRTSFAIRP